MRRIMVVGVAVVAAAVLVKIVAMSVGALTRLAEAVTDTAITLGALALLIVMIGSAARGRQRTRRTTAGPTPHLEHERLRCVQLIAWRRRDQTLSDEVAVSLLRYVTDPGRQATDLQLVSRWLVYASSFEDFESKVLWVTVAGSKPSMLNTS